MLNLQDRHVLLARYMFNTYFYKYMDDSVYDSQLKKALLNTEFREFYYKNYYPTRIKIYSRNVLQNKEVYNIKGTNKNNLNLELVYIYTSFLYYKLNFSLIKDNLYDILCKYLLDNYNNTTYLFNRRVSKDDLEAGTGYSICETLFSWEKESCYSIYLNAKYIDLDYLELNIEKCLNK